MTTEIPPTPPKKKFPAWAKVLIVLAALGMFLLALAGIGLYFFLGKGTEIALEKTIEKAFKTEGKDIDVDLDFGRKEIRIQGKDGKESADIRIDDQGVRIRTKEGEDLLAVGEGTKLPSWAPKDFPVYSPSTVAGSMAMGPLKSFILETDDPVATVTAFYKKEAAAGGWSSDVAMEDAKAFTGTFRKGPQSITLVITPSDEKPGKTQIVVGLAQE